jgi:hypothetical protein
MSNQPSFDERMRPRHGETGEKIMMPVGSPWTVGCQLPQPRATRDGARCPCHGILEALERSI